MTYIHAAASDIKGGHVPLIHSMVAEPVKHAAQFYAPGVFGKDKDMPNLNYKNTDSTQMLADAPEAVGTGGGAVLGARLIQSGVNAARTGAAAAGLPSPKVPLIEGPVDEAGAGPKVKPTITSDARTSLSGPREPIAEDLIGAREPGTVGGNIPLPFRRLDPSFGPKMVDTPAGPKSAGSDIAAPIIRTGVKAVNAVAPAAVGAAVSHVMGGSPLVDAGVALGSELIGKGVPKVSTLIPEIPGEDFGRTPEEIDTRAILSESHSLRQEVSDARADMKKYETVGATDSPQYKEAKTRYEKAQDRLTPIDYDTAGQISADTARARLNDPNVKAGPDIGNMLQIEKSKLGPGERIGTDVKRTDLIHRKLADQAEIDALANAEIEKLTKKSQPLVSAPQESPDSLAMERLKNMKTEPVVRPGVKIGDQNKPLIEQPAEEEPKVAPGHTATPESSNMHSYKTSPSEGELHVSFKKAPDVVHVHDGMSKAELDEFKNAESKGKAYAKVKAAHPQVAKIVKETRTDF